MKKNILTRNKKALLALSLACISAFSLCFMTACKEEETNKDNSTINKTDKETIANGNFEYYSEDSDRSTIISPSGWSKSTDASTSTKASGIIDTEVTHWIELTSHSTAYSEEMDLKAVTDAWEDVFTIYDRLAFYKAVKAGKYKDAGLTSLSDFEYYSDYSYSSATIDDMPECKNPGTHDGYHNIDESKESKETSVLMIQNKRSDGYGTAQKYTSSTTITVPANTAAKVSVWVKTTNLTYGNGSDVDGNRGAYIGVTHTLGGTTLSQMQIKNIDTSSVTDNNGWKQYTIYVKGSSYASSTFSLVLGLGQGNSTNRYENIEGYAFFDDVKCETLTNEEYDEATKGNVPTCYAFDTEKEKKFSADEMPKNNVFALNLYGAFEDLNVAKEVNVTYGLTEDKSINDKVYTTSGANAYKGLSLETKNDVTRTGTVSDLKKINNSYLNKILEKDFASFPFDEEDKVIMLMSANGAAYTAKMTQAHNEFTLAPGENKAYTFFTKTSAMDGFTGATINLVDGTRKVAIGAIDSTTVEKVKTDENDDLFDGWVQCFFFVTNDTDTEKTFSLEFSFGPTSIVGTNKNNYLEGYAAFTGFKALEMDDTEFSHVSAGSNSSMVSLYGKIKTEANAFDSAIYSDSKAIETGFAIPLNYQGVAGGSYYVGGTQDIKANTLETAGLINQKYADTYYDTDWAKMLIAAAEDSSMTVALNKDNWFGQIFGIASQPLVIVNAVEQSYGYIAKSLSTLSTSSYMTVAVDVTVSKGAVAYVYLVNTDSLKKGYKDLITLKTPNVTFWYDDDGNICKKDPSSDEFNGKQDIAYYLNENGLYESADGKDTNLYANLKAFEKACEFDSVLYPENTDEGKNLVTKNGNIVFYYHDGAYYAQYNENKDTYSLKVTDIPDSFASEYARYYNLQDKELYTVIDNRNGDKTIHEVVTYYIATGMESKSYRVEVFSGNREGTVKSKAGSFVAFDSVAYSSLPSNYDTLLSETIDRIVEEDNGVTLDKETNRLMKDGKIYENSLYYTFTFYDSANYTRYDEAADPTNNYVVYDSAKDNPGNLYESYQQSDYSESLIYLKDGYTTYVNFNAIDTNVNPEYPDEENKEDNKIEWTTQLFTMVASIVLSIVLVFAMIAILIKRILKNRKRKSPEEIEAKKKAKAEKKKAKAMKKA